MLKDLNHKNIFLFDGCGAVLSAGMTGLLLPLFHEWIGLSVELLHKLAVIPAIFALFSLSCQFFVKDKKPWMLMVIMFANLSYCLLSGFILSFNESITLLGQSFLILIKIRLCAPNAATSLRLKPPQGSRVRR